MGDSTRRVLSPLCTKRIGGLNEQVIGDCTTMVYLIHVGSEDGTYYQAEGELRIETPRSHEERRDIWNLLIWPQKVIGGIFVSSNAPLDRRFGAWYYCQTPELALGSIGPDKTRLVRLRYPLTVSSSSEAPKRTKGKE